MKKWIQASLWRLEVKDDDVVKWINEKNVPMLNYVLYKGRSHQVFNVLQKALEFGIELKGYKLKALTQDEDPYVAEWAQKHLDHRVPWFYI